MSCIYKIKEAKASFTETEKKIADYILSHVEEVVEYSAQVLADEVNTSAAAVIRFSKKLGFKGFTAMKVELARDNGDKDVKDFTEIIKQDDSIKTLIKKTHTSNINTIEQVYNLINPDTLESAIHVMKKARRIYLLGVGASGEVCNDLLHKLLRIDRNVFYHTDSHIQIASVAHITKDDVVVAISYGGDTKEVVTAVQYAKQKQATIIGITQFKKNVLTKLSDYLFRLPTEEKELRIGAISSRTASLIITDLLYLGIAKDSLNQTKERLVKTRGLIKEFK